MMGNKRHVTFSILSLLIWVTINSMMLTESTKQNTTCNLEVEVEWNYANPGQNTYERLQYFSVNTRGSHFCELPIHELVHQIVCVYVRGSSYFRLDCSHNTQIVFTNPQNLQKRPLPTAIWNIGSDVSFLHTAMFGWLMRLRTVFVKVGSVIEERMENDSGLTYVSPVTYIRVPQLIPTLDNVTKMNLQRALYTYKWPNKLDLELHNVNVSVGKINLKSIRSYITQLMVSKSQDLPWTQQVRGYTQNYTSEGERTPEYASQTMRGNAIHNFSLVKLKGNLHTLLLPSNQIKQLGRETFSGLARLEILDLTGNLLTNLPDGVFAKLTLLKTLLLGDNLITHVSDKTFEGLHQLNDLNIDGNQLHYISQYTFGPLQALITLSLKNNSITTFEDYAFSPTTHDTELTILPPQLTQVFLQNNQISHFPSWIFYLPSVETVNLSRNHLSFEIFERHLTDFDTRRFPPKKRMIDLRYNRFALLNAEILNENNEKRNTFMRILDFVYIDLRNNDIECKCETYSMYKLIKTSREPTEFKDFETWICAVPKDVRDKPLLKVRDDMFMCKEAREDCPLLCVCFKRGADSSIVVDCGGRNMTSLPLAVPAGTDTLLLANNAIRYVGHKYYLVALKRMDLRDNYLESIPAGFSYLQKSNLTLTGNKFRCDCHSVRWIFQHRYNITDVETVFCNFDGSQKKVLDLAVKLNELCGLSKQALKGISIGTGVSLISLIVMMVLVHRFRGEIKLLLYFHLKWHPFDRTNDNDIEDMLYDAFVSYGKDDTLWVINTLRPALENAENPFRLCIHERDFKPGQSITHNIMYSVKYSRRMIMVLTRNFVRSEYCSLEFIAAHRRVLKERTNYVIMILFDDVDIDDLDEDLKLYLRTNTYIEYNSQWFWDRLQYSMPQEPLCVLRGEEFPEEGFPILFPHPESVYIMQQIQNRRLQLLNELAEEEQENEERHVVQEVAMV